MLRPPAAGAVAYGHTRAAATELHTHLRRLAERDAKRVCDVGGGATPVMSLRDILQLGLDYIVLDESEDELAKTPAGYQLVRCNILDPGAVDKLVQERGAFDVVVSKFTAEHVPEGKRFHEQVFRMLRPGGTAIHLFPTLYSPPFLLNRLLPARVSAFVETHARSRAKGSHTKFRPYYSWCRGPSRKQVRRYEGLGFSVERYIGFFGHDYYARVRPLHRAHALATEWLLAHPCPSMTSFALVVLTRSGPSQRLSPSGEAS